MDKAMDEEIRESIARNLPKMVGEELTKRLQAGEKAIHELQGKLAEFAEMEKVLRDVTLQLTEAKSVAETLKAKESNLNAREKAVIAKENKIEVMEAKIGAAEYGRESVYKLAEIAFRNPKMVLTDNGYIPYKDGNGFLSSASFMATRTIEEAK